MICSSVNLFFIVQFPFKGDWTLNRGAAVYWGQVIPPIIHRNGFAVSRLRASLHFSHYPHRNAILGRASTLEELAFFHEPGSGF
jgi:hypothetical protein